MVAVEDIDFEGLSFVGRGSGSMLRFTRTNVSFLKCYFVDIETYLWIIKVLAGSLDIMRCYFKGIDAGSTVLVVSTSDFSVMNSVFDTQAYGCFFGLL